MLLENLGLGYNLFLIELYTHPSMGFVLYNVPDLMGNHFYRQKTKAIVEVQGCCRALWHAELIFQTDFCDRRIGKP